MIIIISHLYLISFETILEFYWVFSFSISCSSGVTFSSHWYTFFARISNSIAFACFLYINYFQMKQVSIFVSNFVCLVLDISCVLKNYFHTARFSINFFLFVKDGTYFQDLRCRYFIFQCVLYRFVRKLDWNCLWNHFWFS